MEQDLLAVFRQRIREMANAEDPQALDQFFLKIEADIYNRALRDIEMNIDSSTNLSDLKEKLATMRLSLPFANSPLTNVIPLNRK